MEEKRMNFLLKFTKNGDMTYKCHTRSIRRFLNNLRTIKWKDGGVLVYLRVSYGKEKDCFGKMVNFYNDGWYEDSEDLWFAFKAFTEKGI